ncbi:restriction endonuclease subunit S [Humidesulfovibrio sp.]
MKKFFSKFDCPSGWASISLGEILPLSYGKSLTDSCRVQYGLVDVLGSSGVVGKHDAALTSSETIVVGRKGNAGNVIYSKFPCWPIDTTFYVEPSRQLDPVFCFRLLHFLRLGELDQSTAIPSLSRDNYSSIQVYLPPGKEQARVASRIEELFSDLDKGEENLRRAQAQLKRYRQSVLKAAVTGELTRAWRERNADTLESGEALLKRILKARREAWEKAELEKLRAKGKPPTDDAWRARYVEPQGPNTEGLPELPQGWAWASVGQLIAEPLKTGLSIKGDSSPPGVPSLKLNSICNGKIDWSKIKYLPVSESDVFDIQIQDGDFFISRGNGSLELVGRGAHAGTPRFFCIYPDIMIRLRFLTEFRTGEYLRDIWDSLLVRSQIQQMAKTTAGIYKISQSQVMSLAVPLPPLDEQERIFESLSSSYAVQNAMLKELSSALRQARALRQSILKAAFSGKLVPQDPKDEPAEELLKRIAAERAAQGARPANSVAPRAPRKARKAHVAAQPSASAPAVPSAAVARTAMSGLAAARKAAGLSQAQLAERAGINQAYVSQMETGKRAITAEQAIAIATALGVEASSLLQE